MTLLEAKQDLCRKLNIDYSDIANNDLFSNTDLEAYINSACLKAWDYKPWDFTEGAKYIASVDSAYYDYPNDFVTGSIFRLKVGDSIYTKLDFKDYQKYMDDDPDGDTKYYAEYKRYYFINQNTYTVGDQINIWGKIKFVKLDDDADLLPFSPDADDNEYSGNQAIVLLAYAEALSSEKKKNPNQAVLEEKKAFTLLDGLWKMFSGYRATEQKTQPFFDVPDYFSGGLNNSYDNIGNFN